LKKDGKSFAVPIGFENDGQYKIYSDEMFFVEDPHELYKHGRRMFGRRLRRMK